MMPIIGLTGAAGAGKDTLAWHLLNTHGWQRVAFADAMKLAAIDANPWIPTDDGLAIIRLSDLIARDGWDTAKREHAEVRRYCQAFGQAIRRELPNAWVDIVAGRIANLILDGEGEGVVITDVRMPNEADLVAMLGGKLIRVVRDDNPDALTGGAAGHVTEHALDDRPVAFTIYNCGTADDLKAAAAYLAGGI